MRGRSTEALRDPPMASRPRIVVAQLRALVGSPTRLIQTVRLLTAVSKRQLLRGRLVVPIDGHELEVPLDRAWAFPAGRYWEEDVVHAFDRLLNERRPAVVYDIGANIGLFTVRSAGRGAVVYAFEPVSATCEVLKRNIERNRLSRARVFRCALSDAHEEVEIHLFSSSGNDSIVAPRTNSPKLLRIGSERVQSERLDELVGSQQLPLPTHVKIDVEGAELRVLRGARRVLQEARPVIVMEHADPVASQAGYRLDDVRAELARYDYSLFALPTEPSEGSLVDLAELERTGQGTIVALPKA